MKKVCYFMLACCLSLIAGTLHAQVTGTKVIGVDYPTLDAAVTALNTLGINGNVIINVPAGYTEIAPAGGFQLGSAVLNPTATSTSTLTIRKNGAGANPILYSPVGTTTNLDGIFILRGTDYVTIDGINLTESAGNVTTTTQMEWGYALLKLQNTAPFDGCQNVTIKNCSITLVRTNTASVGIYAGNHIATVITALTLTATTDAMNNCSFYSNTIQNCNTGISLRGFIAPSPYTLYDQGNDVGGSSALTGNTIQNFAGAATGSGVNLQYQNNVNVAYNTINNIAGGGIASTLILYGVYVQAGVNINANVLNNTISLTVGTTGSATYGVDCIFTSTGTVNVSNNQLTINGGSTGIIYGIYFSGAISNIVTNYNSFYNINVATTSTLYLIYHTGSASPINNTCIGNYTSGPSLPYLTKSSASGTVYCYYNFASSTGGTTTHANNNFSNISLSGSNSFYGIYENNGGSGQNKFMRNNVISNVSTVSGTMYGLYPGYSLTQSISDCQVFNFSTSGIIYGVYIGSSTNTDTIRNCRFSNLVSTGNSVYGIYQTSSGTTHRFYSDTINTLSTSGVSSNVYAIYQTVGTNVEIYKNRIYDLSGNGTGSSVNAMYLNAGTASVWNNIIGDIRTPNYTTATANSGTQLVGIYCGAGTAHILSFNTVDINASSTGANFGSSAVFAATTNTTFRNNIFVNTSTPNGTGIVAAYRRSSTTLTGYQSASDRNLFYAGSPAANKVIMYDGTTAYQTLATYKSLVAPRDAASISEDIAFQSLTGGGVNFLRPSLTIATQVESNGANVAGITDDHYGTIRAGNAGYTGSGVAPDMGAVEDNYIPLDLSSPNIIYSPLAFTCATTDRVFTASIADVTGVATGALAPRVYYRKNAGGWFSSQGVLTSGTAISGTWMFTIIGSDMGGVAGGDVVSYYVIAQDLASTPNVGSIPSGVVATNVNSVSAAPGAPATYNVAAPLNGTYTVGAGQTYTTITQAISAYNNSCLSGPVIFQLMDASYTGETFPLTIGANPFASAVNTLTIRPNAGTAVTINGLAASVAIFKLLNASYVNIDGVNTGGASLTLNSLNTGTNSVIWLASTSGTGPGNNFIGIRNLNINGGTTTSTGNWAVLSGPDGATPSNAVAPDNDNITIQGNTIQKCGYAFAGFGTSAVSAGGLDNWVISNNIIGPGAYGATTNIGFNGLYMGGMVNLTIANNTFQNIGLTTSTTQTAGIVLTTNVNGLAINGNTIRNITAAASVSGTSSVCAISLGTNVINGNISSNNIYSISNNATGGYGCRAVILNTANASSNLTLANNMISDITSYSDAGAIYWPMGISLDGTTGGVNIYFNSINLYGPHVGLTSATGSACIYVNSTGGSFNVRNNILVNTYDNTTSTTDKGWTIYSAVASSVFSNINYNNYYVSSPNVLAYLGSDRADLTAIQAGFGGNANSLNIAPTFVAPTDLHLQIIGANIPLIAGTPIAGLTNDFDGNTRNATTPSMGAHEIALPACSGTPVAGTANASALSGCGTFTSNLSASGTTTGVSGLVFVWQISADNIAPYADIAGATNAAYTATVTSTAFYRLKVTCSNSGFSSSTVGIQLISNTIPSAITGTPSSICVATNSTLTTASTGGTWSSSNTSVATVVSGTGIATGVATGTSVMSYINTTTGCYTTYVLSVQPSPSAITVTPATTQTVCFGVGAAFTASSVAPAVPASSQNFSAGLGSWTIDNTGTTATPATVQWNIQANGYTPGGSITGTFNSPDNSSFIMANSDAGGSGVVTVTKLISPVFSLVGYTSASLAFQQWYQVWASGDAVVAVEISTDGGSAWSVLQSYMGTAQGSPSAFVSSSVPLNAYAGLSNLRIRFHYNSTWGFGWALDNIQVSGTPVPAYSWTGVSGTTDIVCPTCGTATITPSVSGANIYTVTATASGCSAVNTVTVNVTAPPAVIGGIASVCVGFTTTLTNTDVPGTWSSANASVATIDLNTGVVTGLTAGTAIISFTRTSNGCVRTRIVTVDATPAAITGIAQVCEAATTTLSNADGGGTWFSANTTIATVGLTTGTVSGILAGTAAITYTLPTGCKRAQVVSVNPLPVLTITPATATTFCIGNSTSAYAASAAMPGFLLLNQNFNGGIADWSIQNGLGSALAYFQVVAAGFDGTVGDGSQMLQVAPALSGTQVQSKVVSPSFSTVGYSSATLTFNHYVLSDVSDGVVAVQYSTDGGTVWNNLASYYNSIAGSDTWAASAPDVSITLPALALGQADVKLRWNYDGSFYGWFLDNIKVNAALPAATYSWTGGTDLSCNTCANPTITPTMSGANVYTVSANSASGCTSTGTVTINVDPLPQMIGGTLTVCAGLTTALSNADGGGTWVSSTPTVATINVTTGVLSGLLAGTTTITYTLPTGCVRTAIATVNPLPENITGIMVVCEGLTTTVSDVTPDGNWSSDNVLVASVDAAGVVTGNGAGTANIVYTLTTGCLKSAEVLVNALPAIIGGTQDVCAGLTTTLTNTSTGGTWISNNTAVATIGLTDGLMTGVTAGNAMITYTLPTGCIRATEATVNPLPEVITGTMDVCVGLTTALNDATTGGDWTSSDAGIASVDAAGIVTGVSAGNATITYMLATGCIRTADVLVNPLPVVITGTQDVCEGLTTTLINTDAGGTWASGNLPVATINSGTGVVTGIQAGNAMITYTLPTGCITSAEVTVNELPAVITGTMDVCEGLTTNLMETTTGGSWSSSDATTASVDAFGVVTGEMAGNATITYMLPTGCIRTADIVVNPLPAMIGGTLEVCEGLTTTLTNTSAGGTWMSSATSTATIDVNDGVANGIIAGNAMITYTLPTGCIRTADVTVNMTPAAITGTPVVCQGLSTTLTDLTPGGSWISGSPTIATITSAGILTGIAAGNAGITYMLSTGCLAATVATVNELPSAFTGSLQVCEGLTTTLGSTPSGGTWGGDNDAVATIDAVSGLVSGIVAGELGITYTLPTGCIRNAVMTVNGSPAAIAGPVEVCVSSSVTLTDAVSGGVWTSSNPSVVTVGSTGVVSGVAAGSVTITYTLPTTCIATYNMLVNPLPVVYNVTGGGNYCAGGTGVHIGTDNSQSGATYRLYLVSSVVGTQTGVSGSPVDFGSYLAAGSYHVLATTDAGCSDGMVGSADIGIIALVTPSVTVATTPGDTVCAGTNTTFTATPVNGGIAPGYSWTVNGAAVASSTDVYNYIPVDGDVIAVTMTSDEVCPSPASATGVVRMTVVSNETPVANVTAFLGTTQVFTGDTVCQGSTVIYNASSLFGGSAPVYTWYKNAVATGTTGSVYAYVPVLGDRITAKLNSNYRCPTTNNVLSNEILLKVDTVYIPAVSLSASTGLNISVGKQVVFTATVKNGGVAPKYQWFVNLLPVNGANGAIYTTDSVHNNDSITCVVYGTGECSYFTFNSLLMKVSTGMVEAVSNTADIRLVPNPNTGEFVISGTLATTSDGEVAMEVTDMLGQIVYKSHASLKGGNLNEKVKLNNTLANGMYMLTVHSGSDSKSFHFVLKQ